MIPQIICKMCSVFKTYIMHKRYQSNLTVRSTRCVNFRDILKKTMERWIGKVAVVTGASSGIGAAICKDLVKAGMIVVGLARRKQRVEELRAQIPSDAPGKLYALQCDVSSDDDVVKAFGWIVFEIGAIHVLVNNAGITRFGPVTGEARSESDLRSTLQTNLWGTIQCTRKAVEIMQRQQIVGAHVIMINSVAGHKVPCSPAMPMLNVYPSSKFGVTALTEVLRQEFNANGMQFKVTVGWI